jgi:hypothetical protein
MLFDSFEFETCLPRPTPKEEREAHLTAGPYADLVIVR